MEADDWRRAAACFAPDIVVDWTCSGERIVRRHDYAAIQAQYPTRTVFWRSRSIVCSSRETER
jgi:hypothetical protein